MKNWWRFSCLKPKIWICLCDTAGPTHSCWSYSALLKAQIPIASSNNNNNNNKIINHISVPDLTVVEFLSLGFYQSSLWFQLDPYRIVCVILYHIGLLNSCYVPAQSKSKGTTQKPGNSKIPLITKELTRKFCRVGNEQTQLVLNIGLRWN